MNTVDMVVVVVEVDGVHTIILACMVHMDLDIRQAGYTQGNSLNCTILLQLYGLFFLQARR